MKKLSILAVALTAVVMLLIAAMPAPQNINVDQIANSGAYFLPVGVDTGTVNALVVNPYPAVAACNSGTFGEDFNFTTTNTNTGATTINPSGTGAVPLLLYTSSALTGGELHGGSQLYGAFCDGNEWILVGSGSAGTAAVPAGPLNLAGAYVIPIPHTGNVAGPGTYGGFTLAEPPGGSLTTSRQMFNFLCVPSSGSGCGGTHNTVGSLGIDNDSIINVTGLEWAFQAAVEHFSTVAFLNQGTNDNVTIQQQDTPAAGALALRVNAPLSTNRVFGVDPVNGSAVLPSFTVSTLPAASSFTNATVIVTDATTFSVGTCTGGGSDRMLAISDGTNWTCH
jgi:hypothetical protein